MDAHRSILPEGKEIGKLLKSRETRTEFRSNQLSQVGGERDEGVQTGSML